MSSDGGPRRRSVFVDGFTHANPIPAACRIDDLVFSSVITGRDPDTGAMPPDLETQCANMFGHVRAIVAASGGSIDDIAKMTVWLSNPADREVLNREWEALFPHADSRPARHSIAASFEGATLIQCDFVAVLDGAG